MVGPPAESTTSPLHLSIAQLSTLSTPGLKLSLPLLPDIFDQWFSRARQQLLRVRLRGLTEPNNAPDNRNRNDELPPVELRRFGHVLSVTPRTHLLSLLPIPAILTS
jgi:hypothetical protein